jgi:hypothetical protein
VATVSRRAFTLALAAIGLLLLSQALMLGLLLERPIRRHTPLMKLDFPLMFEGQKANGHCFVSLQRGTYVISVMVPVDAWLGAGLTPELTGYCRIVEGEKEVFVERVQLSVSKAYLKDLLDEHMAHKAVVAAAGERVLPWPWTNFTPGFADVRLGLVRFEEQYGDYELRWDIDLSWGGHREQNSASAIENLASDVEAVLRLETFLDAI